jgi:hypothetical protein
MNDIYLSSHILMHICFYPKQFLAIIEYFTISYYRLFLSYVIIGYFMLFHHMLLLVILCYIAIGYVWLFHYKLLLVILNYCKLFNVI